MISINYVTLITLIIKVALNSRWRRRSLLALQRLVFNEGQMNAICLIVGFVLNKKIIILVTLTSAWITVLSAAKSVVGRKRLDFDCDFGYPRNNRDL